MGDDRVVADRKRVVNNNLRNSIRAKQKGHEHCQDQAIEMRRSTSHNLAGEPVCCSEDESESGLSTQLPLGARTRSSLVRAVQGELFALGVASNRENRGSSLVTTPLGLDVDTGASDRLSCRYG